MLVVRTMGKMSYHIPRMDMVISFNLEGTEPQVIEWVQKVSPEMMLVE